MSYNRRSRKGRFLPVVGYVAVLTVSVCILYSGASLLIYSLLGHEHGNTMKPHGASKPENDMAQKTHIALSSSNPNHFHNVLNHILVPRVVGTPSHSKVKAYIKEQLNSYGWLVTSDIFPDNTPIFGELIFENIIARLNPSAKEVVVLACHYDSKYFPNMEFLGATDSAVPCAMLLNLAFCLKEEFKNLRTADVSLELWFFDGEEAFLDWGPHDSLYGARHLAQKMARENTLSRIKCLVLLDLLGPPNPVMYNYYNEREVFKHLVASEKALRSGGHMIKQYSAGNMFFRNQRVGHYVEDDHTPFLQRNVPVVHGIPERFPEVWHTVRDNYDAIDLDTIEDLNKVLRLFILRYFNLCE